MAKVLRCPMGEGEDLAHDLVARLKENERTEYIFQRDLDRASAALQEERKYADPDQYFLENPEVADSLNDDSRVLNDFLDTEGEGADESQPLYGEQLRISGQLKPRDPSHRL